MSVEKAKEFLKELVKDEKLQKLFSGFTVDELKQAGEEMRSNSELSDNDLDNVAGGENSGVGVFVTVI